MVENATPDSLAGEAGLLRGDVLISVNRERTDILGAENIRAALTAAGQKCELGILRDGRVQQITFKLRDLL